MSTTDEWRSRGVGENGNSDGVPPYSPTPPLRFSRESGLFITFEGVEGAGKTTQIALLRDVLAAQGRRVVTVREPGGTPAGESIRSVLLSASDPVTPAAEVLLFLAARAQLVERVIRPALAAGDVVICDRYTDSTLAYQGYARGYDVDWLRRFNDFATGRLQPDITFLLDLDPEQGLRRQSDHNRMECESLTFHQRVRTGFLQIAAAEPSRFVVIDSAQPKGEVHSRIMNALAERSSAPPAFSRLPTPDSRRPSPEAMP